MALAETPFSLVCTIKRANAKDIRAMRDSLVSKRKARNMTKHLFIPFGEANAKISVQCGTHEFVD